MEQKWFRFFSNHFLFFIWNVLFLKFGLYRCGSPCIYTKKFYDKILLLNYEFGWFFLDWFYLVRVYTKKLYEYYFKIMRNTYYEVMFCPTRSQSRIYVTIYVCHWSLSIALVELKDPITRYSAYFLVYSLIYIYIYLF